MISKCLAHRTTFKKTPAQPPGFISTERMTLSKKQKTFKCAVINVTIINSPKDVDEPCL